MASLVTSLSTAFSALALLVHPVAAPAPAPAPAHVPLLAQVHAPLPMLTRPAGSRLTVLGATTSFGSARVLSVVRRSGHWLRVTTGDLENGRDGWIDANAPGVTISTTPVEIAIRLAARTLELRRDGRVVRRFTVGIGAPGSPTPTGRFAVTDELSGPSYSPVYGCCILALSARQTRLPSGWTGGDRIAIHGTNVPSTIGRALSSGCVHAADDDLRYLMKLAPLGTPVTIV
jgi:lipoprotein-anchoring transpeptidase ErfK/SrfK